ncbi:MAG: heavy-metal-associated domain-containing protein [Brachymonas sp.]|nr:heavy-metal-associated domain-containing protein [Brachymonas sp.]
MLTFNVQDMTCGHCARAITEAVQELDPSATVEVDINTKRVTVDKHRVGAEAIAKTITEAGYTPVAV